MQSTKRPAIEDLEKVPRIRSMSRDSSMIVREYNFNHAQAGKQREWKVKEDELARREAAVVANERALREREAALSAKLVDVARREAALAARSGTLADDECRRYSVGDRPRTASISSATTGCAPTGTSSSSIATGGPQQPLLFRAHSASDVLMHPVVGMHGAPDLKRTRSMSIQVPTAGAVGVGGGVGEVVMGGVTPSLTPSFAFSGEQQHGYGVGSDRRPSIASTTSTSSFQSFGAAAASTPYCTNEDTEMYGTSGYTSTATPRASVTTGCAGFGIGASKAFSSGSAVPVSLTSGVDAYGRSYTPRAASGTSGM